MNSNVSGNTKQMQSSPVIFRGEPDGKLRSAGSFMRPYFFAERVDQAALYAGRGTEPVACVITCDRVLDLTELDYKNPDHQSVVTELIECFDEWTDRYSGEPCSAWELIELGNLYDYEGNGSGERWNRLLRIALDQFEAVRILDMTDGTQGQAVPVWVCQDRRIIRMATPGEELAARVEQRSTCDLERWLQKHHGALLERITRLRIIDEEYRFDNLSNIMPANELRGLPSSLRIDLDRGCPAGGQIRPGDWVSWDKQYAQQHGGSSHVAKLQAVDAQDIYWSGTDSNEFFYLPRAWQVQSTSPSDYLSRLGVDQIKSLMDGEVHDIARFAEEIRQVNNHIETFFDAEKCGIHHGPAHWERVCAHAISVARAQGANPLVPYLFGLVHDSHRENEDFDPQHGARAANFIEKYAGTLFSFLDDKNRQLLSQACALHSDGHTEAHLLVQIAWDSDRLDLWRVGIEPEPTYLCTDYAKRKEVIDFALQMVRAHEDHHHNDFRMICR